MNILLDIIWTILFTLILDIGMVVYGLQDARIGAKVRKSKHSCLLNFGRLLVLIFIQVIYYYAVGMKRWYTIINFILFAHTFFFMYVGTKFCVIGLTGGIACGKSTLSGILNSFP